MERRCSKCGDSDHHAVDCRNSDFHCFNCRKFGHRVREYPLHNRRDSLTIEVTHNSEIASALPGLHVIAFLHLINPRRPPDVATIESTLNFAWRRQGGWWVVKRVSEAVFHVQFPSGEEAKKAIADGVFQFSGFNATLSMVDGLWCKAQTSTLLRMGQHAATSISSLESSILRTTDSSVR